MKYSFDTLIEKFQMSKSKSMKNNSGNLIAGVLFLMTAMLNALNIDYAAYDWLDILPAILFGIAGILSIREYLKKRAEEKTKNE